MIVTGLSAAIITALFTRPEGMQGLQNLLPYLDRFHRFPVLLFTALLFHQQTYMGLHSLYMFQD